MAIKGRAQKTLTKIFDGSGVFSIIITNENTSIPISNQGLALNYSATPTDAYVYSGTSILTPVKSNPEAGQYTISVDGENITPGLVSMNGNHASVGNASNMVSGKDSYSINITASGKDFLGNPFTSQKKQVITPLKRGDDATSFWLNVTSSVITKDVKNNMTPSDITVSSVAQSGFSDPREYNAIFKVYYKTGIDFPSTPNYISSSPESSYKIIPDPGVNDIRVELYDATGTNLLDIQTVPVISQANGVISTKIVYTVTSSQVQPNDSANWSDTVPTVGKGQYLWTKTTFYYTDGSNAVAYSMGSNGKDGASAALLTLVADSQIVTFDSDGSTPIPASQTITLTAILQNLTGTATFVATPYSGTAAGTPVTLGGTGNVRTLTASQFGSQYDSISVKATLGNLSDTETIHKLTKGEPGDPGPKGTDGQNGSDGAPGPKGADGKTTYVHIAYANSADGKTDFSTTNNVDKLYIGVLTDEVQQDSTDYTKYTWSIFKGADGADGTPGQKGADGRTPYVHFAYANSSDGRTSFSVTDPTGRAYVGTLTDYIVADSTDPTKYTWSLIKGADGTDGKNGTDGAPGPKGADGRTSYVHVAYANNSDGTSGFSTTDATGKGYIGVYTDFTAADSSTPSVYTWSLVKGQDGQNGTDGAPGPKGADGRTTYIHIAYANSADGKIDFSTTENSGKMYIGTLTDYTVADSTDYTKYTWSLFKGVDGADGTPGPKGVDGRTPYVHFAYANSSDGTMDFSTTVYANKKFIGTLTDYIVADSTDPTKYTWSLIKGADGTDGQNGTDGAPGPKGADGRTSYVHVAYANSSESRNYVQNSSGLNGSSIVRPTLMGTTSASNSATVTYPSDGILLTNDATNTTREWYYEVASAWTKFSDTPLTPGKPITFSADVMGTVPQAVLRYGFNGTGGKESFKNFDINNTSWTHVSITVTSTSTNTGLYFRIQGGINNQYNSGWAGGETLKFRYVKIEDGNIPGFSTTDTIGKEYIGVYTDFTVEDSTDPTKYTWSLVKGQDGRDGSDGIQGPKGADGISTYIHFAYANSSDGKTDFSTTVYAGKTYLGTLTDTTVADSTDYTKYTWSLIKGADGSDGIQGPKGADGISTYVHFAYANSSDGRTSFSVTDTTGRAYVGTLTDTTVADSTDPTKYTWSLIKGADGTNGKNGTNSYSGWLTNESITLQADSNGNVPSFTSATGSFVVYNGLTQVTGLTITQANASGITVSLSGMNYSVTGMSADNGYVDLSVTTGGITIIKRLTIAKSKAGATGANGTSVVNSTTPPKNPTEGQWWNDLSVIPNILKVYQKGSWIPYRIDAINLVAGSVKTGNLAADVLLASNVKYTNSNGTTTNLQTFDFDGIKTLLTDTHGNTYSSMDNAVSSTQSWTSLSKQVNDLGQVNQLINTEFSPDFSGWYDRGLHGKSINAYLGTPRNGSNVIAKVDGSPTRLQSEPIAVTPGMKVSYSVNKLSSITLWSYLNCSDKDGNIINVPNTSSNEIAVASRNNTGFIKIENITIPDGVYYVSLGFLIASIIPNGDLFQQPMLVFSESVGAYVPGQYNNNVRVLKIEESADEFQISIGKSVKDAKSSADSANTKVDNLSVGGRNYVQNSSGLNGSSTVRPTLIGATSGANATITYPSDGILMTNGATNTTTEWYYQVANAWTNFGATPLTSGKQVTFSADVMGTVPQAVLRYGFNGGTGGKESYKSFDINNTSWTRVSITVTPTSTNTGLYFRIQGGMNNQYTNGWSGGETLKFRYVKIEDGNTPTAWSPAPEDVQAGINQAVDSIAVGGRNYLYGTSYPTSIVGNNTTNQGKSFYKITLNSLDSLYQEFKKISDYYTLAYDWVYTGTNPSGKFVPQWNMSPWGLSSTDKTTTLSTSNTSGTCVFTDLMPTNWSGITGLPFLNFRLDNVPPTGTLTISNVRLIPGNKNYPWTIAPEDTTYDGRNLIQNSQSLNFTVGSNASATTIKSSFDSNTNMWHITSPKGGSNNAGIYFSESAIKNGYPWTLSYDIKGTGSIGAGFGTRIEGSTTVSDMSGTVGSDWSRVSVTGYSVQDNRAVVIYFDSTQKALDVYIKLPKLEIGTKATPWSIAPEDTANGIANAQSSADTAKQNAKSAQTSADTANTNLSNASQSGIRYLRFRGEGNTDNQASHFGNISVFNTVGTDILAGKTATTIGNPTISGDGLGATTDGKYNTSYLGIEYNATNHEQYIMFDLGSLRYDVNKIEIGMWTTARTYYGVKAQSSTDGNTWQTIYVGNITPNQLVGNATTGQVVGTTISFGMDTSTVLKLTADNYTLGIDANGNLISGITGNTQQVTLKGNVIHLDGNTVAGPDFFSLWNGKYGSTTIDSTGMEVRTGLSKTKFTNGNMQFITDLGENIGYIGRQVDSVHNNLDYLTFGLNGWHTTYPGDEHYDNTGSNTDKYYGGDGILFGISNADGGYAPLLQWNSGLAASYKSSISGWLFTQPIVGGIDIYGDDYASNKTVSMRFQNVKMSNGFTYPIMTSQQAAGSTGIVIGSGNTYMLGGNSFVWSVAGNGYAYYNTQKRASSGASLLMASDGAIVAQSSATKYKSDIEYEPGTAYGDKLLTIDPATWADKNEKNQLQNYKDTGKEPDYSLNKDGARYYGLIAEDMVKAGLEGLIIRNTETGSVEGIQYDKIGIALIPLLRDQRNQINELRVEVERLKEKTNE